MNSNVPHISIEQHPNPEMRTYHVTRQVSKIQRFGFGIDQIISSLDEKEDPGLLGKRLAKALAQIPGVTAGTLKAYEIDVTKGNAFDWSEIGPLVVGQIVKRVFPKCVGGTIEVSTTANYMSGDYCHHQDIAKRCNVPVTFEKKERRPRLDVEELFKSPTLVKVVDNIQCEAKAASVASGETPVSDKTANG